MKFINFIHSFNEQTLFPMHKEDVKVGDSVIVSHRDNKRYGILLSKTNGEVYKIVSLSYNPIYEMISIKPIVIRAYPDEVEKFDISNSDINVFIKIDYIINNIRENKDVFGELMWFFNTLMKYHSYGNYEYTYKIKYENGNILLITGNKSINLKKYHYIKRIKN